jgi:2-iminobutanoate/2-iminopropanoate deaminase
MKAIQTQDAPAAIGPYSQAIMAGNLMFVSGQIPLDPKTGQMVQQTIEAEVKQVLTNLSAIVKAAGCDLGNIVKTTIFLTDLSHFAAVNEIYGSFFKQPFPARSTIQVAALPKGARVEIEAIVKVS